MAMVMLNGDGDGDCDCVMVMSTVSFIGIIMHKDKGFIFREISSNRSIVSSSSEVIKVLKESPLCSKLCKEVQIAKSSIAHCQGNLSFFSYLNLFAKFETKCH